MYICLYIYTHPVSPAYVLWPQALASFAALPVAFPSFNPIDIDIAVDIYIYIYRSIGRERDRYS